MDSFDFHRLTDFDFEELCKDLFEDELGLKFEIFSRGRDHGIDLRHSCSDHGLVIVQCKHWIRSDGTRLVRHFRTEEKPKIERLKPDRYLIATTTELSVDNKDSMVKDLQPWIRRPPATYMAPMTWRLCSVRTPNSSNAISGSGSVAPLCSTR